MREIKFRAWHKGYPKTGHIPAIKPHMIYPDKQQQIFNWLEEKQPIEVMQFTGLIDKNGKEIYEGDIVRNWQGGWNVVVYKAPTFEATISADQSCMYSIEWWREVEVIGNIYENPVLLNQ